MAEWYGDTWEIDVLRKVYPTIAKIVDDVFDIVGVHENVYVNKEYRSFLGIYSKDNGAGGNIIDAPETIEETYLMEIIGGEADISLPHPNSKPTYIIYSSNGFVLAAVYLLKNGGYYVAMNDIHHTRQAEKESDYLVILNKVIEFLKGNFQEVLERAVHKALLEKLKELENVKIKEVVVEKYVPDTETITTVLDSIIRTKTVELQAKVSRLERENRELKENYSIPLKVMRTLEKVFSSGWKINRRHETHYEFIYPKKITVRFIRYKDKTYLYDGNDLFVKNLVAVVDGKLKKILSVRAMDHHHLNVNPWEDDPDYGTVCLGDLDGAPFEKLPEVPKMLETLNLNSAFETDFTDELEERVLDGEFKEVEISWDVDDSFDESTDDESYDSAEVWEA